MIPIDLSGTGLLQCIHILSYIHLYSPKIIILDEPDSHIHPDNQIMLARLLTTIVDKRDGFQVILATHSRYMIETLIDSGAKINWVQNGEIKDFDSDVTKIFSDIGALGIFDWLSGKDTLVMTEDSDTRYLEILLGSNGYDMEKTVIKSYGSSSEIDKAFGVIEAL